MLATAIAPVFNSFPASAFAQNVGVVAITGIRSRWVVTAGGSVLVVLGCCRSSAASWPRCPQPVLGGAGIVLFGSVAASGIRTLSKVDYDGNLNIVLVATALGFGMIPIAVPAFYDEFPEWFATIFDSGISAASIVAVLLNLFFNVMRGGVGQLALRRLRRPHPSWSPRTRPGRCASGDPAARTPLHLAARQHDAIPPARLPPRTERCLS